MNQREVHALPKEKLIEIAEMYGVEIADFGPVEGGYRNVSHSFTGTDGKFYNFILYKHETGIVELIERTNALGTYVATNNVPVRVPVDARILQVGRRYGSLYGYLGGETIPWEAYSMKHIKLLGYAMAKFHTAGENYRSPALPDVETVYADIANRMGDYFAQADVQKALTEKLNVSVLFPEFQHLLNSMKQLSGRIPLHMDLVRSNVLFREAQDSDTLAIEHLALSGILDLEKAAMGHPLFDIARTLAFLLVDCAKPEEKIRKYFLDSGYWKRGQRDVYGGTLSRVSLSDSLGVNGRSVLPRSAGKAEPSRATQASVSGSELLEQLITLFLTYDLYKFLKQNPYESLSKNHHFKRTIDILLARKVVQYSN